MPVKSRRRFKIIKKDLRSAHGSDGPWVVGEWRTPTGPWFDNSEVTISDLELCHVGYHCSDHLLDASYYVQPGLVALVETKGRGRGSTVRKSVWLQMKIVSVHRWTRADTKALFSYIKTILRKKTLAYNLNSSESGDIYAVRSWAEDVLDGHRNLVPRIDAWVLRRLRANKITPKKKP
jgi:hypothetical protein